MVRSLVQILLATTVLTAPVFAQNPSPQRQWYRGFFDGAVDLKTNPQPGYYYHPSPDPAYPLYEASYGQPIYCNACGHYHYPGQDVCPYCGAQCPAGGNQESPQTVYTPAPLPGQYYFQQQPHYRFASPIRVGQPYLQYKRSMD